MGIIILFNNFEKMCSEDLARSGGFIKRQNE